MRDFEIIVPGQTIRLCVDLNIWVRYLLGRRAGTVRSSSANAIVEAVQRARSPSGPIQLIVSHTMLSRLEDVLVRLSFQPDDAGVRGFSWSTSDP